MRVTNIDTSRHSGQLGRWTPPSDTTTLCATDSAVIIPQVLHLRDDHYSQNPSSPCQALLAEAPRLNIVPVVLVIGQREVIGRRRNDR